MAKNAIPILEKNVDIRNWKKFYHLNPLWQCLPERIYNSHYGNGVPAILVYLLVLSSWKVNIAENPIAVMGL